ncbi:MAG TPA: hypothetical protein P5016_04335 [Verrucomicrobiales bacterium]|nr:hypothetical protein [Verrucomicrobiae bacterium]HRX53710.1 hypothetical protein [Verrucomicrobiales bacterium]
MEKRPVTISMLNGGRPLPERVLRVWEDWLGAAAQRSQSMIESSWKTVNQSTSNSFEGSEAMG